MNALTVTQTNQTVATAPLTPVNQLIDSTKQLNQYYCFADEQINEVIDFIVTHQLSDFLVWLNQPINAIFGAVKKTLHLEKKWDEEECRLILTIYSGLDDMDKLTLLEDKLFDLLSANKKLSFIGDVLIAQG